MFSERGTNNKMLYERPSEMYKMLYERPSEMFQGENVVLC